MKLTLRAVAVTAALFCVATSFGQSKNPEELLRSINQFRSDRITDARASGKAIDANALNADVAAKATEAIQGVDASKVEAAQAFAWAQIFSLAGKHKETCDLANKYLKTKPSPDQRFAAQMLMLNACDTLGEGKMIAKTLPGVAPPNLAASQTLLRSVVNAYSEEILKDMGVKAAFKALDNAMSKLQIEAPDAYAKRMFEPTKARNPKNRDGSDMTSEQITAQLVTSGKSLNDSMGYSVVNRKVGILTDANRSDEAKKMLEAYIAAGDPNGVYVRRAASELKKMTIVGSPFVALNFDRQHGEFKGLEQWKGKVVIIDFTAHW
jgi:hypothetical protein